MSEEEFKNLENNDFANRKERIDRYDKLINFKVLVL